MRLLIDEQLSPRLVDRLADAGIFAQHVVHIGLRGRSDPAIWRHAYEKDFAVVTMNAMDFLALAAEMELHPGLVVLRESGLTRDEQWSRLEPVVKHLKDTAASLVNQVVEVRGPGDFEIRDLPRRRGE
jgi:predicted nuclease of predicted toxin-antitoxin system